MCIKDIIIIMVNLNRVMLLAWKKRCIEIVNDSCCCCFGSVTESGGEVGQRAGSD